MPGTALLRRSTALIILLSSLALSLGPAPAHAQSAERCFAETGYCISGRIREYWERNGGLPVFGLPLGPQQEITVEGKTVQAQWFERHRLELHPENPRPYDVLLGRLGADLLAQQGRDWTTFPAVDQAGGDAENCRFFAETRHTVCGEFLQAYRLRGLDLGQPGNSFAESLALFGLPLSEVQTETIEGREYQVQWFERARFELHPELRSRVRILLGRLGAELAGQGGGAPQPSDPAIVTVAGGALRGALAGDVAAFKGIPYAAPPVGELRWRAPQPPQPWEGLRDATAFGADCAQAPSELEPIQTAPSENCLFINVWRPTGAAAGAGLPVLVWVHGGGFVGGGTSIPWYDGTAFARQGLVVVSMNYRLGRFGFFAHPALLRADEGPVGNFGFMDQIAALQWVRANIGAFGGDPGQVTLLGESAGGASVLTLLTSPAADGLFQRAMIMSGGGREALVTRPITGGTPEAPSADQTDAAFAQSLGIAGDGAATLAALRALPAETIAGDLNLNAVLGAALAGSRAYPGVPMIDGAIVTARPAEIFARGEAANVPLIIGTTAQDLPLQFPPSRLDPFAYFGADADAARAAYGAPPTLDQQSLTLLLLSIGMDMTMHEPARFVARQMNARGNPAWLYRFTYTAESTRPASVATGQSHAGELPFLFDRLGARYGNAVTPKDQQAATAFNSYVANFARTGDPNGGGLPPWPRFDPGRFELLNFTFDDGPVFGPDPRAARVELVQRAADRQAP